MAYNFLNDNLGTFFANASGMGGFMFSRTPDYETLTAEFPMSVPPKTEEILEHDFETFSKILSFLNGNLSTFILHGFMGSGKSAMINLLPEVIHPSVLYFRVNCFESTNLDDVLLSLHTDFVKYHNEKKIVLPKVDSNNFTERINAYIRSGNSPMLFVFDSVDSEKCPLHAEIINFIKHISQIEKIKVIVTSRNLAANDLPNDSSTNFAVIKLCGKEEFVKLLENHDIKANDETYEDAFVASKGHYLYISLMINVISLLQISLSRLYNDYSKKNWTIFEFLVSKVLTLIPEKFFKSLWFLSLIRTGVSEDFMITQKLAAHDELAYLEERMLLCREGSNLYLKDYVKKAVLETMDAKTKKDIHIYLHELYESQLPKKPSERDLIISRSTMRRESAYHKEEADNTVVTVTQPQANKTNLDYGYLSYSNSINKDWNFSESSISSRQRTIKPAPRGMETRINNNLRARQFELSNEEMNFLNQINMKVPHAEFVKPVKNLAVPQNNFPMQSKIESNSVNPDVQPTMSGGRRVEQQQPIHEPETVPHIQTQNTPTQEKQETLATVMQEASLAEQEFNYEKALAIYGKAYSMTEEAGYTDAKPIIMMQTAYCHRRMQNNEAALREFETAYKLYSSDNPQKANTALFNMAEIYTETYNHTQAKAMYEKILLSGQTSDLAFNARVLLNLAEIENNNTNFDKASEYYNKALSEATQAEDNSLICECCFKYGLACDDDGDIEMAFKLYLRCVQTSDDYEINPYISSASSNIAEIYEEQNQPDKASKYYEIAVNADEKQENWEGVYFAYSKLATLNIQQKLTEKAAEYSLKALNAAQQLNDDRYIASAYIQTGDLSYQTNQNEDALKSYLSAKEYLMKQPNPDNIRKIDVRIDNVKSRLGSVLFNQITAQFGTNNG